MSLGAGGLPLAGVSSGGPSRRFATRRCRFALPPALRDAEKRRSRGFVLPNARGDPQPHAVSLPSATFFRLPLSRRSESGRLTTRQPPATEPAFRRGHSNPACGQFASEPTSYFLSGCSVERFSRSSTVAVLGKPTLKRRRVTIGSSPLFGWRCSLFRLRDDTLEHERDRAVAVALAEARGPHARLPRRIPWSDVFQTPAVASLRVGPPDDTPATGNGAGSSSRIIRANIHKRILRYDCCLAATVPICSIRARECVGAIVRTSRRDIAAG